MAAYSHAALQLLLFFRELIPRLHVLRQGRQLHIFGNALAASAWRNGARESYPSQHHTCLDIFRYHHGSLKRIVRSIVSNVVEKWLPGFQ